MEKEKHEEVRHHIYGERKSTTLLEGTQAMPARPSYKGKVRVKRLGQ
jgi:hypothetical protein